MGVNGANGQDQVPRGATIEATSSGGPRRRPRSAASVLGQRVRQSHGPSLRRGEPATRGTSAASGKRRTRATRPRVTRPGAGWWSERWDGCRNAGRFWCATPKILQLPGAVSTGLWIVGSSVLSAGRVEKGFQATGYLTDLLDRPTDRLDAQFGSRIKRFHRLSADFSPYARLVITRALLLIPSTAALV